MQKNQGMDDTAQMGACMTAQEFERVNEEFDMSSIVSPACAYLRAMQLRQVSPVRHWVELRPRLSQFYRSFASIVRHRWATCAQHCNILICVALPARNELCCLDHVDMSLRSLEMQDKSAVDVLPALHHADMAAPASAMVGTHVTVNSHMPCSHALCTFMMPW